MQISTQIAKNLDGVFFGGNWTVASMKEHLADVTWQQATAKREGFNTIAALAYHINYYVTAMIDVLQGRPLTASDKFSFAHPAIQSQEDWDNLLQKIWTDAETLGQLVAQMPDEKLWTDFKDNKYGNYYRNLHGIIEHAHYHLGQIVLLKKLV